VQGVAFQFVNPKLWTMMAAAVAAYGSQAGGEDVVRTGIAFGLIFGIATFVGCSVWALLGAQVGRVMKTERAMRLFNWSMAALLIASVIPVIVD
jgi:threonine/homoserine/homoserine lactone efflux protein